MANLAKTPWFPLILVALAYSLLGWHLAAYHILWTVGSFMGAFLLTATLIWGGRTVGNIFRLGPRSVLTMFLLSAAITIAVAASTLFALILILLLAEILARLEMQSVGGFGQLFSFGTISLVACLGLWLGWFTGVAIVPSSRFWLEVFWQALSFWV